MKIKWYKIIFCLYYFGKVIETALSDRTLKFYFGSNTKGKWGYLKLVINYEFKEIFKGY